MFDEIKGNNKESDFVFKEARAPRNKTSRRLQALIGEPTSSDTPYVITPQTYHRFNAFYRSLDKVLSEITVNRTRWLGYLDHVTNMLLFIFIFGHVTRKGGVMFRESYLHRVFVHTLRSQNRILELF